MNSKENVTKEKNQGISLIALVITIIVIVILASAVFLNLNNNNTISNASDAKIEQDLGTMQIALDNAMQKVAVKYKFSAKPNSGKIASGTDGQKEIVGNISFETANEKSGNVIFDKGTDTDTTFYTGYKLPIYGTSTDWYVDENGKLILQTGSRIYGANEVPKPTINAATISKNAPNYYGAYVNYTTTNTLTENYKWRIFYATNSNIYLIASDYVNVADLPTTAKGHKPANTNSSYPKAAPFNNVINDYNGSTSIAEDMKWFNKEYFDKGYTSTNKNMRAVAYMLDKNIWTDKFKGNGTEYVVGGPSLDMVLNSYNQYTGQSNMYQTKAENKRGYKLSADGGTTWNNYLDSSSKYLTQGNDLYSISNYSNKARGYWISSPSAHKPDYDDADIIMRVMHNGHVSLNNYFDNITGFRSVICLKSGISLKEVEAGKSYEI